MPRAKKSTSTSEGPTPWERLRAGLGTLLAGPLAGSSYADAVALLTREDGDVPPNLLLYGPRGPLIDLVWREALDQRCSTVIRHWQERTIRHIVFHECPYAFDIDLANPNNPKEALTDQEMLPDLVRDLVSAPPVYAHALTPGPAAAKRHIVVLRNIDRIVHPYTFRVLLERFSRNVWFIATTHSLSSIEAPIRSRFLLIRIPSPTQDQLAAIQDQTGVNLAAALARDSTGDDGPLSALLDGLFAANGGKPGITEIRACANALVCKNIPLRDVAAALLARFPKRRERLTPVLARIELHFAMTSRGREPIYHELMLHETIYGYGAKDRV